MNKFIMSKGLGKVLDNKFVKKAMIPVGNKIIGATKKVSNNLLGPLEKKMKLDEEKDKKQKQEFKEYQSDPANFSRRNTSNGYMRRG